MVALPALANGRTPPPEPEEVGLRATVQLCSSRLTVRPAPPEPARMPLPKLVEVLKATVVLVSVALRSKLTACRARPPPCEAELPLTVLLVTVSVPPSMRRMPPPAKVEVLLATEQESTVRLPLLATPPPPLP